MKEKYKKQFKNISKGTVYIWELFQIKIIAQFQAEINTPNMLLRMTEQIINNPISSLVGKDKSNLSNNFFLQSIQFISLKPINCIYHWKE